MNKLLWVTLVAVLGKYHVYAQEPCCEDYCLGKDNERKQTRRFTSKTAYQFVRGNDLDLDFQVPNCTATKFWMTSRHGTRLPYRDTIINAPKLEEIKAQILTNYLTLQTRPEYGALCIEDFLSIQSWKFNSSIKPETARFLTFQGYEDLKYLAKTYQQIFPNILLKEYNSEKYLFHHTQNQRAEESFKAFADGLFGPGVHTNIDRDIVPEINDTLLRGYLSCPIWKKNNWNIYNTKDTEYFRFRQTDLMKKTISDISRRLGFKTPLDFEDIELMWDWCRLEQAWHVNRPSIWCAAFTPTQFIMFEYLDDLKFFLNCGYGHEINSRVSCNLAQDMLHKMDSDDDPNAVAYFAHSSTIETLITTLGIRKDSVHPTADNFESMSDRKWKTSEINPFSSNLVAVKFECSSEESNESSEKAMFFLNQKRVDFDWCNQGLCDWSNVLKQYQHLYKANCTKYFCSLSSSSSSSTSKGGIITAIRLAILSVIFSIVNLFN